jgi:hypothetical protein
MYAPTLLAAIAISQEAGGPDPGSIEDDGAAEKPAVEYADEQSNNEESTGGFAEPAGDSGYRSSVPAEPFYHKGSQFNAAIWLGICLIISAVILVVGGIICTRMLLKVKQE